MTALITLDEAKAHLRVETDDFDDDITANIEEATEICLDYIDKRGTGDPVEEWDESTVPLPIRAAIKIMLSKLFDDRSAGKEDNQTAKGYLPPAVTSLLHRFRDPALA